LSHVTMYGPASCGSTGGPWCNYVWKNDNYPAPVKYLIVGSFKDTGDRAL